MRRATLLALAAIILLPGCSLVSGGTFEHRIIVDNGDDREHTVEIAITKGDTQVLADRRPVPAGEMWRVMNLTDSGSHEIRVALENGAVVEDTRDLPLEPNTGSYTIITITDAGTLEVDVIILD